jgi:glycosyltransferase involved in cell wall biosynthesis
MSKLFSVCIPTYNRVNCLSESLQVLLPQAEQGNIDVCVSDNHSTDGTSDYLKSLALHYKCLKYIIQKQNYGLDKNMISAMSMAKTEYILPIGDDENIIDGGIRLIKAELTEKKPDLMILDGWHIGADIKYKKKHLQSSLQQHSVFYNPVEAFSKLWDKMPLGSFVVRKDCLVDRYFKKFLGTSHAYTGMVWEYLLEKFKLNENIHIECFPEPIILYRSVKKSYSSDTAQIHLYEIPQWFIRLPSEYHRVSTNILSQYLHQQSKFIALVNYRAIGQLTPKTIDKFMVEFSNKQKSKALFVTNLPQNVAYSIMVTRKLLSFIKSRIYK